MVFLKDVFEFDFKVGPHLATHLYDGPSTLGKKTVHNGPVHGPDIRIGHMFFCSVDLTAEYSDLNEMPMKSLYEAERVSNILFTNETVFREHIIQVSISYTV